MNQDINYSFIIPHKNIPKLLQRCLHSIPRRDDVQIIVVDDNSDPENVDFKNFPGLYDPFVEVYLTKDGKGQNFARNFALTKAKGKWLLFADADDFYNYSINTILDEYVNSDYDIVFFKHDSVDSDLYTRKKRMLHYNEHIDNLVKSTQNSKKTKADIALRKCPLNWSRLYKSELLKKNNISFDNVSIATDVAFGYLTGHHAVSISADPRVLYIFTVRSGSVRNQKITDDKQLDLLYTLFKRYKFFHNKIKYREIPKEINIVYNFYFHNRAYFTKAMDILQNLKFTPKQIFTFCIFDIIFLKPTRRVLWVLSLPGKFLKFFNR